MSTFPYMHHYAPKFWTYSLTKSRVASSGLAMSSDRIASSDASSVPSQCIWRNEPCHGTATPFVSLKLMAQPCNAPVTRSFRVQTHQNDRWKFGNMGQNSTTYSSDIVYVQYYHSVRTIYVNMKSTDLWQSKPVTVLRGRYVLFSHFGKGRLI